MPVELIGWVAPQVESEILAAAGPPFDPEMIAESARVHEAADFDLALIGYFSHAPDGFLVAAHAATVTDRLRFLIAHRPGFVAPTLAARKLATLDQLTGGRVVVHMIAGGHDAEQARDGDFLDKAGRYRRTTEYVDLLKRTWTSPAPFDYAGEFYRVERQYAQVRCRTEPRIPIYGGGGSDAAIAALAEHIDLFMLWGEPLAETEAFMARVRAAAGANPIRFSVSTRPILGRTDAEAWERARDILEKIEGRTGGHAPYRPQNAGSKRLLAIADDAEVHDTCLYTALAKATGAPGNSTALVGSPETVARAMFAYYERGVTSLLIRGYDPLVDARAYGEELIPRLRELVAARDAQAT